MIPIKISKSHGALTFQNKDNKSTINHTNKDYVKLKYPIIPNITPSKPKIEVTTNIQVLKPQKGK
jgi:hypothetical protein